jgi:tetratricopeptide (TPR) repeat protein
MTLFRQKEALNWAPTITEVVESLIKLIAEKPVRWKAKTYDEHPSLLGTNVAGAQFFLQSAFQYHLDGKLEQAKALYQEVLQIEMGNIDAIRNLAALHRGMGNHTQAIDLYEHAISMGSKDSILLSNYASLLIETGKKEKALDCIRQALEINQENNAAQKMYLELVGDQFKTENLSEIRQASIKEVPSNSALIADVLNPLKESQVGLAMENLTRLLSLSTTTIEHVLLAAHVYQEGGKTSKAMECYERAITLNPNHPEIYINKAVLHAKCGNYEEAIKDVKKCIKLSPDYAEAHFHLGIYLLSLGKYQEGWREYEWRMG